MPGRRRRGRRSRNATSSSSSSSEDPTNTYKSNYCSNNNNSRSVDLPEWFQLCKKRQIFDYDTKRYPFKELYSDWLGISSNDLHQIHTIPSLKESKEPIHPKIVQAWKNSASTTTTMQKMSSLPKLPVAARTWDTSCQQKLFQSPQYHRLINTYRLFIREVIAPMCCICSSCSSSGCCDNSSGCIDKNIETMNDDHDDDVSSSSIDETTNTIPTTKTTTTNHDNNNNNNNVVYQCPPTTRVVFPMGKRTISMHSDKDYKNHQPAEINFWIPLTKVWGSNTLWLESLPGKNDFQPQELDYGQCLKFDGYECRHYTIDNTTTHTCRVSFDFRVIPSTLCIQKYRIGDFCVEETTSNGYISYPHKFWMITGQGGSNKKQSTNNNDNIDNNPKQQQQQREENEERQPYHTTLSSLQDSMVLPLKTATTPDDTTPK